MSIELRRFCLARYEEPQPDKSPECRAARMEPIADGAYVEASPLVLAAPQMAALLGECARHFKTLREAGVFVWPNHPENPEKKIAALLADAGVE